MTALRVATDAFVMAAGVWLALQLRFDFVVPAPFASRWPAMAATGAAILLAVGAMRGIYGSVPKFAGVLELIRLVETVAITTVVLLAIAKLAPGEGHVLPLSVPPIAGMIVLLTMGAVRFAPRILDHVRVGRAHQGDVHRVLVVGAGNAGEMLVRDMLRNPQAGWQPVGFADDDPLKRRKKIHGVPVVSGTDAIEQAVRDTSADLVMVAMPSAKSGVIRDVLDQTTSLPVKTKIVPGLDDLMGAPVTLADIRDVDVADLIGREPVRLDTDEIAGFLEDKCVLITGAAGSIGSELSRQVARFRPSKLLLLDNDETEVYDLLLRLGPMASRNGVQTEMIVASVRDRTAVDVAFAAHKPNVVFHAAANKHVPVMEQYPCEAVLTNVTGTRLVAEAAIEHGAERFILVSTDKAVNPSSVMGASKRIAEMMISSLGRRSSAVFASVRFGNVLGSRGSVVPAFKQQIREGGPITVTHPEATRYFMTIEEAASLIIQAGALAHRGEIFVLDMGEPVKIVDLAIRMRDLLARDRRDSIQITYMGLRAGEKLHEELWHSHEDLLASEHPRIRKVRQSESGAGVTPDGIVSWLEERAAAHAAADEIRELLFNAAKQQSDTVIRLA